jgi:anti-anti-sigma factor
MEVKRIEENGVTVLSLHGRFDAAAAPDAESVFKDLINENLNQVVVDLADVEYISSGGLRVMIMLAKSLDKSGGALRLCALSPFVSEVFELTNLNNRYVLCDTRAEAVTSLMGDNS